MQAKEAFLLAQFTGRSFFELIHGAIHMAIKGEAGSRHAGLEIGASGSREDGRNFLSALNTVYILARTVSNDMHFTSQGCSIFDAAGSRFLYLRHSHSSRAEKVAQALNQVVEMARIDGPLAVHL